MICNPNSTSQNEELFRQVIPTIRNVPGLTIVSQFTHYPGHAEDMVSDLTREDYDAIIAVGGDGTVNEVVNGLLGPVEESAPDYQHLPALAIIPTGSANVFARALGFSADPVHATEELARLLEDNVRRTICLGTWDKRWFAVNAGFGLDADVLNRVDKAREHGFSATPLRYLSITVQAYLRARREPPRINVHAKAKDGRTLDLKEAPLMLASNTNPWTFLGPLPVVTNPRNSFDEGLGLFGLSDLTGIHGLVGMLRLMGVDRRRWLNKVTEASTIQFDDAEEVVLECPEPHRFQADGESEGSLEKVTLRTGRDVFEVFAPQETLPPHKQSLQNMLRNFLRIK